jgi:hypothetical protein
MATESQIPFSFGPSGARSINNITFGNTPLDLKSLLTGKPTYKNPGEFIAARNLEVLTTLDTKNMQLGKPLYNTEAIGLQFGVPQDTINLAAANAAIRVEQDKKGARIDSMVNTAIDAGLAVILAVDAFIASEIVAPLYTAAPVAAAGSEPVSLTTSELATNAAVRGVQTSVTGLAVGQGARTAIDIFGQKIGGFLTNLFTMNFAGAIQSLTGDPTAPGPHPGPVFLTGPGQNYGGGGGGGLGIGGDSNSGQTTSNLIFYGGLAIAGAFLLWLWMKRR